MAATIPNSNKHAAAKEHRVMRMDRGISNLCPGIARAALVFIIRLAFCRDFVPPPADFNKARVEQWS